MNVVHHDVNYSFYEPMLENLLSTDALLSVGVEEGLDELLEVLGRRDPGLGGLVKLGSEDAFEHVGVGGALEGVHSADHQVHYYAQLPVVHVEVLLQAQDHFGGVVDGGADMFHQFGGLF